MGIAHLAGHRALLESLQLLCLHAVADYGNPLPLASEGPPFVERLWAGHGLPAGLGMPGLQAPLMGSAPAQLSAQVACQRRCLASLSLALHQHLCGLAVIAVSWMRLPSCSCGVSALWYSQAGLPLYRLLQALCLRRQVVRPLRMHT